MFEPERRQAGDVFGFDVIARGYELVQGGGSLIMALRRKAPNAGQKSCNFKL